MKCSVCYSTLDLHDHLPQVLSCGHSACKSCITSKATGNSINCKKCGRQSRMSDVSIDVNVTDRLKTLCEDCFVGDRINHCHHCSKMLCNPCTEAHGVKYHKQLTETLASLQAKFYAASSIFDDVRKQQQEKESATMREISETAQRHVNTVKTMEVNLISAVKEYTKNNIQEHKIWEDQLEATSVRASAFAAQATDRLGRTYSNTSSVDMMSKIHDECNTLSDELVHLLQTKPNITDYSFQKHDEAYIGTVFQHTANEIKSAPLLPEPSAREGAIATAPLEPSVTEGATAALPRTPTRTDYLLPVDEETTGCVQKNNNVHPPEQLGAIGGAVGGITGAHNGNAQHLEPAGQEQIQILSENSISLEVEYSTARFMCKAGSNGAGAEQFEKPCSIACMKDRIFVTDEENHRVKVYSHDLDLLFTFGGKGSKRSEFTHPAGIAVSSDNRVYISDCNNHQIKVYAAYGELIGTFGSKGKNVHQMDKPYGIAVCETGHLYVCEMGNFRVKVMTLEGHFIRAIGSKGSRPGEFENPPMFVALTNDDKILVKEKGRQNLHVYRTAGVYLGDFVTENPEVLGSFLPNGIATDYKGNIYVADAYSRIVVFDKDGKMKFQFGSLGKQNGMFNVALNVAVHKDKYVYVCDWQNHRIQKLELS